MKIIRRARYQDIPDIIHFLKKYWRKSILSQDELFFEWMFSNSQYRSSSKKYAEMIDFILAYSSSEIEGCLGIIQSKSYTNEATRSRNIIWYTNWLSINEKSLIGARMIKFAEKHLEYDVIGTIGCNSNAQQIYKSLGYSIGEMSRLLAINTSIRSRKLLSISCESLDLYNSLCSKGRNTNCRLKRIVNKAEIVTCIDNVIQRGNGSLKDCLYYLNRYFFHPIYTYEFYIIELSNCSEESAILIIRRCVDHFAQALRIVDVIGSLSFVLSASQQWLGRLLNDDIEYIDIYHLINSRSEISETGGFVDITQLPGVVAPGYFEPFIRSNSTIKTAFKYKSEIGSKYIAYKGDCDQDRPS